MNRNKFLIIFGIIMLIISGFINNYAGQNQAEEILSANKETVISLKKSETKTVFLNLKKGEFAEISWEDSLQRLPDFSLVSPSGKELLEDIYVSDSILFIAPEDGKYRFLVKFDEGGEKDEDAKVILSYTNKFSLPKSAKLARQKRINGYAIRVFNDQESSNTYLLIEKNGKMQEILKGGSLVGGGFNFADDSSLFDSPEGKRSAALMRTTSDKTGNGTPDIAVQFYSGGAHCCIDLHFYELGKDGITKLKNIPGMDSDVIATGKKPNGSLILKTGDSTFAYWQACFACSPIPTVILSYSKGEFRPDLKLMKKSAPSPAILKQKAAKARQKMDLKPYLGEGVEGSAYFQEAFWDEMLDLLYSGNETAAWQYFDLVWDKQKAGKEKFKDDFLNQLNKSKFWKMMQTDKASQK